MNQVLLWNEVLVKLLQNPYKVILLFFYQRELTEDFLCICSHTLYQTADLSRAFFFVQFGCKAITYEALTPCCPSIGFMKVETGGRFKPRHLPLLVLHLYLTRLHCKTELFTHCFFQFTSETMSYLFMFCMYG